MKFTFCPRKTIHRNKSFISWGTFRLTVSGIFMELYDYRFVYFKKTLAIHSFDTIYGEMLSMEINIFRSI